MDHGQFFETDTAIINVNSIVYVNKAARQVVLLGGQVLAEFNRAEWETLLAALGSTARSPALTG